MKIHLSIFAASICLALLGCATQAPVNGNKPPRPIHQVNPVYPYEAKERGITGVVIVWFTIDENGNVVSPSIVSSPDPLLSRATLDAISQWKFIPAEKNGVKVSVEMETPFRFAMDSSQFFSNY